MMMKMDAIRYRPGEALRWLEHGVDSAKDSAKEKGRKITDPNPTDGPMKKVGKGIQNAAGAVMDMGKGAMADLLLAKADSAEYVMLDHQIDIVSGRSIRAVKYTDVRSIHRKGDRVILTLENGQITIKPYAHIVAGKMKVPIGWSRNGVEVPYELLADELSARCGTTIVEG